VCVTTVLVSLTAYLLLQQLLQLGRLQKTEEYPVDPKPAEGGDLQLEYSDYFFCQSIGALTKIASKNFGHYSYRLIIWKMQ